MKLHTQALLTLMLFTAMASASGMKQNSDEFGDVFKELIKDIKTHRNHFAGYIIHTYPSVVHCQELGGKTALAYAVECENAEVCKELLRCGASPENLQSEHSAIQPLLDLYRNPSWFEKKFTIPSLEEHVDDTCRMLEFDSYVNHNQPITDQVLLSTNPVRQLMKRHCSQATKDRMLLIALDDRFYYQIPDHYIPNRFYLKSTLIALAVCIGANPNLEFIRGKRTETALNYSIQHTLHSLTRYLLAKGARRINKMILAHCADLDIARELVARGTPIPVHILQRCFDFYEQQHCSKEEMVSFLNFYLHCGAELTIDADKNSVLHHAAVYKNEAACKTIVFFFIEQHRSFLAFLWCLKKKYPALYYTHQRAFLKRYFGHAKPLIKLHDALYHTNRASKRPFDIFPIDILKIQRKETVFYDCFTPQELYIRLKNRMDKEKIV